MKNDKKILTWDEAFSGAEGLSKSILLGNGFSIAFNERFSYKSLIEVADFTGLEEVKKLFEEVDTNDFEEVIRFLDSAQKVLLTYTNSWPTPQTLKRCSEATKELLIKTIERIHPKRPNLIELERLHSAIAFLSHFQDNGSVLFSINYDLLLYWLINASHSGKSHYKLKREDGFRYENSLLVWRNEQKDCCYLHGALHLYSSSTGVSKISWSSESAPLLDQIAEKIRQDEFPLYVAEGESSNKYRKIKNNPYLNDYFNFFNEVLNRENACLFTYGVSFSENDKHIFGVIRDSKLRKLFVGIHGDFTSEENRNIRTRALSYKARPVDDLEIYFYNTQEVNPWTAFKKKSEDEG